MVYFTVSFVFTRAAISARVSKLTQINFKSLVLQKDINEIIEVVL
jgi:hypothetical protein